MNTIKVNSIKCCGPKIEVKFSCNEEIRHYFKEFSMSCEYFQNDIPCHIENIPSSLCIIPFVVNVLPIVWVTNSLLELPCLDEDFYNSIKYFKDGYINMYPNIEFAGDIKVESIQKNKLKDQSASACFFSGGVDAYCTLCRHIDEVPDLCTVWGADIPFENTAGWNILKSSILNEAHRLDLTLLVIRSSFRKMVNERALTDLIYPYTNDGWWHAMQHGIGLIGLYAPLAYIRGTKNLYIAASYCKEAYCKCASDPTIDNYVKFAGVEVFHDAFISRQEKIRIICHSKNNGFPIKLHVCWQNTSGDNCCICEKCARTIMGLLAEGENPKEYGFKLNLIKYIKLIFKLKYIIDYGAIEIPFWKDIQNTAYLNKAIIKKNKLYSYIKWIYNFDFNRKKINPVISVLIKIKRKIF